MKNKSELLALADGEYMLAKAEAREQNKPNAITIPKIEKRFKLKPKSLSWYRDNLYCKSHQSR